MAVYYHKDKASYYYIFLRHILNPFLLLKGLTTSFLSIKTLLRAPESITISTRTPPIDNFTFSDCDNDFQ